MPTLLEASANLVGEVASLPRLLAQKYINQAILEIRRDYMWSWNIGEGILITPEMISDGTVSVTQFSNVVTFDLDGQIALNAIENSNPPLINRQFRIPGGPVYNILAYDNTNGNTTLDRVYGEATGQGMNYNVYRCYYDPPSVDGITPNVDFLRYLTINNTQQGYTISGRRLNQPREILNRRDPMRGALGSPYYAFVYKPRPNTLPGNLGLTTGGPTNGLMQYELWPHPTYQNALLAQYERAHVNLVPNDSLPYGCPETLVKYRALEFAYRWALQNIGRYPELKGTDWRFLLNEVQSKYTKELVGAKRNDKEIQHVILRPGTANLANFLGPVDDSWAQSHGVGY